MLQKCSQNPLWEPLGQPFGLLGASLGTLLVSWGRPLDLLGPSWGASWAAKSRFFHLLAPKVLPKCPQATPEAEKLIILMLSATISPLFSPEKSIIPSCFPSHMSTPCRTNLRIQTSTMDFESRRFTKVQADSPGRASAERHTSVPQVARCGGLRGALSIMPYNSLLKLSRPPVTAAPRSTSRLD